jgi:hypothetical protein
MSWLTSLCVHLHLYAQVGFGLGVLHQTRIVELEKNIIALGINPKDPIYMGELVKQKDTEIKVLRKRLNLPEAQHVQTPELQASYEEKEQLYHQLNKSKRIIA